MAISSSETTRERIDYVKTKAETKEIARSRDDFGKKKDWEGGGIMKRCLQVHHHSLENRQLIV